MPPVIIGGDVRQPAAVQRKHLPAGAGRGGVWCHLHRAAARLLQPQAAGSCGRAGDQPVRRQHELLSSLCLGADEFGGSPPNVLVLSVSFPPFSSWYESGRQSVDLN